MTIIKHELNQSKSSLIAWTVSIGFLIAVCIFMFPQMKSEMDSVSNMFASMGSFTEAFGMDKISFGTLTGFFSVECGNIIGLGGAFFAALCGVSALCREEKEHTAQFLLTHPISRVKIISGKLIAILIQILILNLAVYAVSIISVAAIKEEIPWKEITLLLLSYLFLQIELAGICFGISAFLHKSGLGIGLGIAIIMYFLNIIKNISDSSVFLKYITPFAYTEGYDIINNHTLDIELVSIGMCFCIVAIVAAYIKYSKKDII